MSALAVITARGGSKRIPRKNVRPFLGKPILAYSIQSAQESKLFDEIMVSTDDAEIADLAMSFGASVPFLRSADSSGDHATTAEALLEVLTAYSDQGRTFEYCCCLYPTAPFVTAETLKRAFQQFQSSSADSLIPVTRFGYPIWRALRLDPVEETIRASFVWPESALKRSQDLPPAYHDCGQFYLLRTARFVQTRSIFTANTICLEVPELHVQDIDTESDWALAELKYQLMLQRVPGDGPL